MTKRRNFSASFKAKVALEALRGDQTLAELASEGMAEVFSGKRGARDSSHEAEIKDLHAKIGELTVEKGGVARRFALWPRPSVVEPHLYGKGAGGYP